MSRQAHRVAMVVFCEAEGVDVHDASAGAAMALRDVFRKASHEDQSLVGITGVPVCALCGSATGLTKDGRVRSHVQGEVGKVLPGSKRCSGAGRVPRKPSEPVVGWMRGDLPIYARVHDVMEVGMAAGNGYLWTQTTGRGFRR